MAEKKLQVSKKDVLETYQNAKPEERGVLEKLFGKEKFISSSDWISLWEKFCKENKLKVSLPHANPSTPDEEWDNSCVMLRHIFKIRRGNWKPDFRNGNQYKYFPVFKLTESGFGFSHSHSYFWHSYSYVGSRLCLPSEKMSNDIAKEFLPIFEKFHMNL